MGKRKHVISFGADSKAKPKMVKIKPSKPIA
jgi:hypothetical protein